MDKKQWQRRIHRQWTQTANIQAFDHTVRIHQSGQAVILEVDGLCLIGDMFSGSSEQGGVKLVFPRQIALAPNVEEAKKAVEMDGVTSDLPQKDDESGS